MQVEHTHRDTILPIFPIQVVDAKSFLFSIFCTDLWEVGDTSLDLGQDEHLGWSQQLEQSLAFAKSVKEKSLSQGNKTNGISGKDMPLQIEQMYVK